MSKQMIINASASEEMRVAILESNDRNDRSNSGNGSNSRLLDLDIENQARSKHKGNIYKGIVANVEDSLEAAFIEFGDDKQAFLALAEVRPSLYPPELKGQRRPKISDVLKRGQEIVVQVTKDEIGNKGAAVTTYLSLPGRYVVLMHSDEQGGGVSRKVDDEHARRRAREVLNHIEVPDGMAVIIRTAGVSRPRIDLYRDLKALASQWEQIDRGAQLGRAPTLLHREPDLVVRTIRDYLAPDITKIVIDNEEEYEELKSYFETLAPESVNILEHHTSKQPIFEKYGIEGQIEDLFEREVKLPSGGYLIVDQTEALVAIDVNSGKSTKEVDHEATVYKTNLEAAAEVARQLRLRDMGGIVVVDFIDMVNRRHDRDVERAVRDAMKDDKARVKIARISENGTMEITRQRLRQAHRLVSHTSCPHCNGTGIVRDPRGLAVKALRELQNRLSKEAQHLSRLTVRLPVEVANLLQNTKRRELVDLGDEHQVLIDITGDVRLQGSEIRFDGERRGKAGLDAAHGVRDPRLVGNDRGRRGGRNQRREQQGFGAGSFGGPTVPPPSIGPVPNFLDGEEAILEADARDAQEALERERLIAEGGVVEEVDERLERSRDGRPPRAPKAPDPAYPEHYDDPLTEALFGKAPADLTLADVSAAEPERAEGAEGDGQEASADGEGGRKRRRRRRKKKKPLGDAQEAAANDEGDDDEDEGDDEPAGDAKSDEPAPSAQLSAEEEAAWAAYKSDGENASASTEAPTTPPMEAASDAQSTLDAEPVSDSSIDGEVVAADEAAPKRRPGRRPRKKASDDEASAPAAALAPES